MFIIEYLLLIIVILSSILGILFVLLQGSQSAKGLFEDGGSNFLISHRGNFISRLTGILLALFLLSNLGLAYFRHTLKEVPEADTPSFINEERLTLDSNEIKQPEVKANEVKQPEVKANEVKQPEVKANEVKQPEVKANEVKKPEVKANEVKKPEVKANEIKQPEVKANEVKQPEVKAN